MVTFVELTPDDGGDEEALTGRRRRRLPAGLARVVAAAPRARYVAALVALVGGLLAADQAGRVAPVVAPVVTPAVAHAGTPAMPASPGPRHCPGGIDCAVWHRPRQDMWVSFNTLFPELRASGGEVWFEPASGIVYYQDLHAAGESGQMIALRQLRLDWPEVSFGPTVDITPGPRRTVLVTARRGPWLVTASLSGPPGVLLPVAAAMEWAADAPLPD